MDCITRLPEEQTLTACILYSLDFRFGPSQEPAFSHVMPSRHMCVEVGRCVRIHRGNDIFRYLCCCANSKAKGRKKTFLWSAMNLRCFFWISSVFLSEWNLCWMICCLFVVWNILKKSPPFQVANCFCCHIHPLCNCLGEKLNQTPLFHPTIERHLFASLNGARATWIKIGFRITFPCLKVFWQKKRLKKEKKNGKESL